MPELEGIKATKEIGLLWPDKILLMQLYGYEEPIARSTACLGGNKAEYH